MCGFDAEVEDIGWQAIDTATVLSTIGIFSFLKTAWCFYVALWVDVNHVFGASVDLVYVCS